MTRGLTGRRSMPSRARFSISAWKLSARVRVELSSRPSHMKPAENCRRISAFGPTAKLKRRSAEAPKTKTAMNWARLRHWRRSSLRRALIKVASRGQGTGDGGQVGVLEFGTSRCRRQDKPLCPVPSITRHHPPPLQHDRAIRIAPPPLRLVRGDQHGCAARLELLHDGVDEAEAVGVELAVRLVEEDHLGLLQQDAREREALAHARRKRADGVVGALR